jgi:tetratricopeptide (TPR) repeat protein
MTLLLFDNSLSQGKLQAALAHLDDPLMWPAMRAAGLYTIHSAGLPVPDATLEEALALPQTDSVPVDIGSTLISFYGGAHAADRGRWDDHAAAVAGLGARADRLLAEGDSAGARFWTGAALALKGQGLWRRGDARNALPLLVDGQRQASWTGVGGEVVNGTIRWWLGELLLEMGRPQDAALYFESFWHDPFAAYRLARIYEQLGDRSKALEAYALVAFAWKDADPELQPRVHEARAAVRRLTGSVRE